MLLFKTIIEEVRDANEVIDFTKYNMSELSPVSTHVSSSASSCELAIPINDVAKFMADAPEIIARKIAYWFYSPDLLPDGVIKYIQFHQIHSIARGNDNLAVAALSLLVHSSRFRLSLFNRFLRAFISDKDPFREATVAESPSQEVKDRALDLLKSEPFLQVLTDTLNAKLDSQARVDTNYVRQCMDQCVISYVYLIDFTIKAWNTPNGININVYGLKKDDYETLGNHVALACLLGHEIQHFLNRNVSGRNIEIVDLNISTPELLQNKSSTDASNLKSNFRNNFELCFEVAAFGGKYSFRKPVSKPLLEELAKRLNASPVILPLIGENEQDMKCVKQCKMPTWNLPYGFNYAYDEDISIE